MEELESEEPREQDGPLQREKSRRCDFACWVVIASLRVGRMEDSTTELIVEMRLDFDASFSSKEWRPRRWNTFFIPTQCFGSIS